MYLMLINETLLNSATHISITNVFRYVYFMFKAEYLGY